MTSFPSFPPSPHIQHLPHSPLDGDVQVGNVVEDELYHLLVVLLTEVPDEGLGRELLTELVGRQAVLGEAVVEVIDDCMWLGR